MPAPAIIHQLVQRFEDNLAAYRSGHYNETQLRNEFLNPFFEALGWDVLNKQGYAEAYKDVVHEDALKIGRDNRAPDYAFRVGGARKFFVEAKKPSVNIKDDISPAFQLRRYAWSAKLPLSILTDFEEFAVYDCRSRPDRSDKSSTGRLMLLTFRQYPEKWDEIAAIFDRQAVLKGSFDRYAEAATGKRGTAEVDDAFLAEIERWRELLARNFALRNPQLSQRELNYAVQMTIDRIIFLRIAEDRGIEPPESMRQVARGGEVYPGLLQLFHKADQRYNSGLFHFQAEKSHADLPDRLTPNLVIDDKPLKDILGHLYYPDSPYEFSVLPADILGQVYEQFLGKVIRLTAGHHAVVEEKPEVKKAGGVFYTPTYIVEYIVKQTLGALLEGKHPGDPGVGKGAPLRVVDPACGSGSFLLGAYQYLLDWYRDGYLAADPQKWARGANPRLAQTPSPSGDLPLGEGRGGGWRLTTAERKRILLDHIYGVDIDPQAVEVTKLSLLLKVLEGENEATIGKQLALFQERALPDLGRNIQCGNSLIGPDFYHAQQASFLDLEEQYRINAFDWAQAFPQVFAAGGFDAVIGNPPYGAMTKIHEDEYLLDKFQTFGPTRDVYTCFLERGLQLLRNTGLLSYIIPSAWVGGPQYLKLRSWVAQHKINALVLLPFDIFENAYVDTLIIVLSAQEPPSNHSVLTYTFPKREKLRRIAISGDQYLKVMQARWVDSDDKKFIFNPDTLALVEHLRSTCTRTFGEFITMKRGVLIEKSLLSETRKNNQYHRYFEGDVYRYVLNSVTNHWIEFGEKLKERPKEFHWFEGRRILLRRLVNRQQRLMAVLSDDTFITNKNLYSIKTETLDYRFFLGLLNSKLISFLYVNQVTQAVKDDFPQITIKDVLALPFPEEKSIYESKRHDQVVALVERMLTLHRQLAAAQTPAERSMLQRQVEATDREIDRLVYALYDLTPAEIQIVEGG